MVDKTELEQIYQHIDDNFEDHLAKVQEFLKTPCFSPEKYGAEKCVAYLQSTLEGLNVNPIEIINVHGTGFKLLVH